MAAQICNAEVFGSGLRDGAGPRNRGCVVLIFDKEHVFESKHDRNSRNQSADAVKHIEFLYFSL